MSIDLRSRLDVLADALTLNPPAAAARVVADGELVGLCTVDVQVGDRTLTIDQPEELGGGGQAPNPVEYALAALGACQAMTYRFWSAKLGLGLEEVRVVVRGDLDVRGIFGLHEGVRPGFGDVEITVEVRGPEAPERYEELRNAVDEHCPLLDIFTNEVPVRTAMTVV